MDPAGSGPLGPSLPTSGLLRAQRSAPFSGKTRTPERAEERLAKKGGIEYIAGGSAKLTGGAPGLQIRCRGVKAFLGGFDSHALP